MKLIHYSILEKAAFDNGFDRQQATVGNWLVFTSTQSPLGLWLTVDSDQRLYAALSLDHVARALGDYGQAAVIDLPAGAVACLTVVDNAAMHRLVRRAFQLSRALPDAPLQRYKQRTAAMPASTEAERLVIQRVGQDIFREGLLSYWQERCAVTGLGVPRLLMASHIKPWAHCQEDAERLDVYNGLLLAPHLDAVFDRGFVSFGDDGALLISSRLDGEACRILGLHGGLRLDRLTDGHRYYLQWHRDKVFE